MKLQKKITQLPKMASVIKFKRSGVVITIRLLNVGLKILFTDKQLRNSQESSMSELPQKALVIFISVKNLIGIRRLYIQIKKINLTFELDSLGNIDSSTAEHLTASSGKTWISEAGPPLAPNKSNYTNWQFTFISNRSSFKKMYSKN